MTQASDSRSLRKGKVTPSQTAAAFTTLARHLDRNTRITIGATVIIAVAHLVCMGLILWAVL